jgi:hypothetical protein
MTETEQKTCAGCDGPLTGRQRKWCSTDCQKDEARRARLEQHFDITPEEYDAILKAQGGGCAVCGRKPKPGKRHAVDHSHRTGFVRGLLCYVDNRRTLGAKSDEAILALAEYITNPPAFAVIGERVAPGRPPKKRRKPRRRPPTKRGKK